jgi:hypothetical protein
MSGQLHAPVSLLPGRCRLNRSRDGPEHRAGHFEQVDKSRFSSGVRTPGHALRSLVTMLITLYRSDRRTDVTIPIHASKQWKYKMLFSCGHTH